MFAGFQVRSLRPVALAAAFAGLLIADAGESLGQPEGPPKKEHKGKGGKGGGKGHGKDEVKAAAGTPVKFIEAEELKKAYILMALANHNYQGHRAKAMGQVEAAIEVLDASILRHGTGGQKVVAVAEEIAAARAAFLAKLQTPVHEPQALSDLQMRAAAQILSGVDGVLARRNQPKVRGHVDRALKQIAAALKAR